jgi:hypothetical protein
MLPRPVGAAGGDTIRLSRSMAIPAAFRPAARKRENRTPSGGTSWASVEGSSHPPPMPYGTYSPGRFRMAPVPAFVAMAA